MFDRHPRNPRPRQTFLRHTYRGVMDILDDLVSIAFPVLIFGGIPMGLIGAVIILLHRSTAEDYRTSRPLGDTAAFLLATVAGVLTWVAWLSWGNHWNYDPWQVVGCVITGLVLVIGLGFLTRWWRSGPLAVALGGMLGFSTTWALDSGPSDSTGLWGVGYMMIVIGGGAALGILAAVVIAVRSRGDQPRSAT